MPNNAMTTLRKAGITLSIDGGGLVARPKAALTDELRALIRVNKSGLMDELGLTAVTGPVVETAAVVREREALKEYFEERVATLAEAGVAAPEIEAAKLTAVFARNARFLWVSLRSAFEGQTDLLVQLPEERGVVDALPLGPASAVVRRDGTVAWQGTFVGGHGV
jgi:hypothetical protein